MRNRGSLLAISLLLGLTVTAGCTRAPVTSRPSAGASLGTSSPTSARPSSGAATTAARTTTPSQVPPSSPAVAPNPGGLTDEQLVGQLFMPYLYGSSATSATPAQQQANLALYGAALPADVVRRYHLGGVLLIDHDTLDPARPYLSTGNVDSAAQISALTAGLQRVARGDSGQQLLIATDQEGGAVQRITDGVSWRPSEQSIAQQGSVAISCGYQRMGQQLLALGVNQDFAPVADVVRVSGGVIGDRSFGPDPQLDARDVVAAVSGLQSAGVLATLKHWPGHGSTSTDSHLQLAVIEESAGQWPSIDAVPFAAAARQVAAVMVGHLALPALDPTGRAATLSPVLVNGWLRGRLGFGGLVVTDSLWMGPMRQAGTPGQVAIAALLAGDDMLLMSPDVGAAYRDVLARVRSDLSFRRVVQLAVGRILLAKARIGRQHPIAGC